MKSRLDEVPALWEFASTIEAQHYNRVRRALMHLGEPIRFSLKPLRGLEVLLGAEVWLCVDASNNDLPVIAWTKFQTHRDALHTPVDCEMRYYHSHAAMIVPTVLEELDRALDQLLAVKGTASVSAMPPKDDD